MDVQVKHHLAAGRLVELLDGEAVGGKDRHRRARDRLRRLDQMGEIVRRDVENGAGRGLGNDQRMAGRARHDVEKGKDLVVLEDLVRRQFAAQNLGEDVVGIVARHCALSAGYAERS